MITVLYFARIRESVGIDEEQIEFEPALANVAGLKSYLSERGEKWAATLLEGEKVLVAVNQEMAGQNHTIDDGDEIAFFPPVTGG